MPEKESRQLTDQDVDKAYIIVVEQVIVELLQLSGASELDGDNIMENLKSLGGHIQRHIVDKHREMVTLTFGETITHVAQIWREGDSILHLIQTAEEIIEKREL